MSCQACNQNMNIETYQNYPWMPKQSESKERFENSASCKETMTNCLFTAQGMFVCQKETGDKPHVPNEDMARWGADQKGAAIGAAPWAFKQ